MRKPMTACFFFLLSFGLLFQPSGSRRRSSQPQRYSFDYDEHPRLGLA